MCCCGSCHKCNVIKWYRVAGLVIGLFIYSTDTIFDFTVAKLMLKEGDKYWAISVMFLSVMSLIISNVSSFSKRYDRNFHLLPPGKHSSVFQLDADFLGRNKVARFFSPWRWNSVTHAFLNLLNLFQLGPVIDALEILFHRGESYRAITLKYSHYKSTKKLERMMESAPQIIIQTISLVRLVTKTDPIILEDLDWGDLVIRVASVTFSCICVVYAIVSEEEACRFSEAEEYDFLLPCKIQIIVLFIAYLSLYISRIFMIALLYYLCRTFDYSTAVNYLPVIIGESHHLMITIVYLVYTVKDNAFADIKIIYRRPLYQLIPIFYVLSFTEVFVINLRFPVHSVGLHLVRVQCKPLGHRSTKTFFTFFTLFGLELGILMNAFVVKILNEETFDKFSREHVMGYTSILLYFLSVSLFVLYFSKLLNPDKIKRKALHKSYITSLEDITCVTKVQL